MNELETTVNQTPIEIALEIDENGMTTARKLYKFLELNPSNFSKWAKRNIVENQFAEENVDFWAFVLNDEWGGQASTDYKLTAHFAKKLSMMQKNERGEEAREYFTRVETYAVDTTLKLKEIYSNPMKILELHYEALKQNENKITDVKNDVSAVRQELQEFKEELPIFGVDEDRIMTATRKKGVHILGGKNSNAYNDKSIRTKVYQDIYRELRRQFGISGTYKQLKRNKCDMAISVIEAYEPPYILQEQIINCNAQINLEVAHA